MASLLTNVAAASALRALAGTQRSLGAVERQVSTGLRVAEASDDAAYWSIGVAMRSRVAAVSAVRDALALTGSIADVTAAAFDGIIATTRSIQADVVSATQPGTDRAAVQRSIAAKQASILGAARSASFNGVNWLTLDTPYKVTEHSVSTEVHSASSSDAAKVRGSAVATADLADGVAYTDQDTLVVDGPDGYTNTITSHAESSDTRTKLRGSSTSRLVSGASTLTVDAGTPVADSQVDVGPASYDETGLTRLTAGAFSIYNVGYRIQSTWDHSQSYADATTTWQDTSTSERYFSSAATDAAFAASTPGSLIGSLLGLDVTDAGSLSIAAGVVAQTLSALVGKAAAVGSLQTRISAQQSFESSLSDALDAGLGSLVDADMSLASTRLQALQTQQRLGLQALSIANDNGSALLKLFAG